jgi:hypothetical protein
MYGMIFWNKLHWETENWAIYHSYHFTYLAMFGITALKHTFIAVSKMGTLLSITINMLYKKSWGYSF